jgi:hypothetical protein
MDARRPVIGGVVALSCSCSHALIRRAPPNTARSNSKPNPDHPSGNVENIAAKNNDQAIKGNVLTDDSSEPRCRGNPSRQESLATTFEVVMADVMITTGVLKLDNSAT